MKHQFLNYLVCPECRSEFDLTVAEESSGQIKTGFLTCKQSGHEYPISKFVPRFVNADQYADSFSRQRLYVRRHFKYYERDKSGDKQFLSTTSFSSEQIQRGVTLEIGCGYGRFVDVVQRLGGTIVGVDLSTHSIELAQDFVGLREDVHLAQCDLFRLPFRTGYFPQVFSIGVLHHTPNTKEAFGAIMPCVQSGGQISIWVYHPSNKSSANRWRVVTTRIPHRLLYSFCILNEALFAWIRALPGGWRFGRIIPGCAVARGRPFWLRVMSDFDSLSPKFAHTHSPEEVSGWFSEHGLRDVRVLPRLTSVTGLAP